MKVLEVFGEPFSVGGQEAFIMNVLQHIDMKDLQIDFLTPYYCDNQYYTSIVEEKGGKVFAFDLPFNPGGLRSSIIKPLDAFFKNNKYDVIHIHSGSISALMICAAIAKKNHIKKIIVHSHATAEKKTLKYRVIKLISMPFMAVCPTDYCACSVPAGEWKFSKRIVKNKLVVLNNGIDLKKFSISPENRRKIRKQLGISDDTFVVGNAGRFSYEKNQQFTVSVFKEIKKLRKNSKLILVGDGDDKEKIISLVEELGLSDDVIFTGVVNNVNEYMQAMDVFLFPSVFEGLGMVAIEAQAVGLPVVASDTVPTDVGIMDNVKFISLKESHKVWAQTVCNIQRLTDSNPEDVLSKNGYNIDSTANMVREIYVK